MSIFILAICNIFSQKGLDFMSRYKYNLNHQIFVECTSSESGRYLSIVDIDAVAMSLSRHGLGVMHRIEDTTNHFLSQVSKREKILLDKFYYILICRNNDLNSQWMRYSVAFQMKYLYRPF